MYQQSIVHIDMHLRDDRVLQILREHADSSGEVRIPQDVIAEWVKCHRNTALAIIHRLVYAQKIEVLPSGKRGGYT